MAKVPIPTAGVALGLASLGNLLGAYSLLAKTVCGVLSACLVCLLLLKVVLCPKSVKDDLGNSIAASVSGTLFMSIMLLAGYIAETLRTVAFALWAAAVLGHVVLIVWFTAKFMRRLKLPEVFPSYFICYVGIMAASVTSPAFGMNSIGRALFWFGFACYLILFVLVTWRYYKHEVPEAARPLFCIYAAPMSLSIVAYLSIEGHPNIAFVTTMLVLAQAMYFFVLYHVPKFMRLDFYPSYAAMTFPFVISTTALVRGIELLFQSGNDILSSELLLNLLSGLSICEIVIALCLVAYVFVHYVLFFFREFTAPYAPDVAAEEAVEDRFDELFED